MLARLASVSFASPPLRLSFMLSAMLTAAAPRRCAACRHEGTGWKPATHAASMHALSARLSIASSANCSGCPVF
eukprot:scaffold28909_cov65-Phaeocystis_antarctica.AAC.2